MNDEPDSCAVDWFADAYNDKTTVRHVCFTLALVALTVSAAS